VVMFVPMESVLAAAFQAAPDIHEEAMRQKVLIASPVTLLALLRTIAVYWRQDKVEENARALWEAAAKLHKRLETFQAHLAKMGRGLGTAFKAYDDSMGSWGRMVIPAAREVEKMGITDRSKGALAELPEVPPPRQAALDEEEEEAGA
jgi:DNA recombination protein RmuC